MLYENIDLEVLLKNRSIFFVEKIVEITLIEENKDFFETESFMFLKKILRNTLLHDLKSVALFLFSGKFLLSKRYLFIVDEIFDIFGSLFLNKNNEILVEYLDFLSKNEIKGLETTEKIVKSLSFFDFYAFFQQKSLLMLFFSIRNFAIFNKIIGEIFFILSRGLSSQETTLYIPWLETLIQIFNQNIQQIPLKHYISIYKGVFYLGSTENREFWVKNLYLEEKCCSENNKATKENFEIRQVLLKENFLDPLLKCNQREIFIRDLLLEAAEFLIFKEKSWALDKLPEEFLQKITEKLEFFTEYCDFSLILKFLSLATGHDSKENSIGFLQKPILFPIFLVSALKITFFKGNNPLLSQFFTVLNEDVLMLTINYYILSKNSPFLETLIMIIFPEEFSEIENCKMSSEFLIQEQKSSSTPEKDINLDKNLPFSIENQIFSLENKKNDSSKANLSSSEEKNIPKEEIQKSWFIMAYEILFSIYNCFPTIGNLTTLLKKSLFTDFDEFGTFFKGPLRFLYQISQKTEKISLFSFNSLESGLCSDVTLQDERFSIYLEAKILYTSTKPIIPLINFLPKGEKKPFFALFLRIKELKTSTFSLYISINSGNSTENLACSDVLINKKWFSLKLSYENSLFSLKFDENFSITQKINSKKTFSKMLKTSFILRFGAFQGEIRNFSLRNDIDLNKDNIDLGIIKSNFFVNLCKDFKESHSGKWVELKKQSCQNEDYNTGKSAFLKIFSLKNSSEKKNTNAFFPKKLKSKDVYFVENLTFLQAFLAAGGIEILLFMWKKGKNESFFYEILEFLKVLLQFDEIYTFFQRKGFEFAVIPLKNVNFPVKKQYILKFCELYEAFMKKGNDEHDFHNIFTSFFMDSEKFSTKIFESRKFYFEKVAVYIENLPFLEDFISKYPIITYFRSLMEVFPNEKEILLKIIEICFQKSSKKCQEVEKLLVFSNNFLTECLNLSRKILFSVDKNTKISFNYTSLEEILLGIVLEKPSNEGLDFLLRVFLGNRRFFFEKYSNVEKLVEKTYQDRRILSIISKSFQTVSEGNCMLLCEKLKESLVFGLNLEESLLKILISSLSLIDNGDFRSHIFQDLYNLITNFQGLKSFFVISSEKSILILTKVLDFKEKNGFFEIKLSFLTEILEISFTQSEVSITSLVNLCSLKTKTKIMKLYFLAFSKMLSNRTFKKNKENLKDNLLKLLIAFRIVLSLFNPSSFIEENEEFWIFLWEFVGFLSFSSEKELIFNDFFDFICDFLLYTNGLSDKIITQFFQILQKILLENRDFWKKNHFLTLKIIVFLGICLKNPINQNIFKESSEFWLIFRNILTVLLNEVISNEKIFSSNSLVEMEEETFVILEYEKDYNNFDNYTEYSNSISIKLGNREFFQNINENFLKKTKSLLEYIENISFLNDFLDLEISKEFLNSIFSGNFAIIYYKYELVTAFFF